MMRRTPAACFDFYGRHMLPAQSSYHAWKPEIRTLDKHEKIPEPSLDTKLSLDFRLIPSADMSWPPMDPVNPTASQQRAQNTTVDQWFYTSATERPYTRGFRTVPPELVDWRTTQYGSAMESLPYGNERLGYDLPDYASTGLLRTAEEEVIQNDNLPRKVSAGTNGPIFSPRFVVAAVKTLFRQATKIKVWTFTKILGTLIFIYYSALLMRCDTRMQQVRDRRLRLWWDGAVVGTWKYGGLRNRWFESAKMWGLAGGDVMPF